VREVYEKLDEDTHIFTRKDGCSASHTRTIIPEESDFDYAHSAWVNQQPNPIPSPTRTQKSFGSVSYWAGDDDGCIYLNPFLTIGMM